MNPMLVSKELAKSLWSDPVATRQLKEHIPAGDLLDMLEISDADLVKYINRYRPKVVEELKPSESTD